MVIPNWLSGYLDEHALKQIEKSVGDIETCTEAEIVPVIVRSSSHYHQAQVTLILIGVLVFSILWEIFGGGTHWDAFNHSVIWAVTGVAVIFGILPRVARIPVIQRLFTVRSEELEQCWKRAQLEFYENRVNQTHDAVGVLIFISMLEKSVIILTDKRIAQVLPNDTWKSVVDEIVKGLKNKKMADGFEKGLALCSDLLIKNFPVKLNDQDELPNTVIIKE